MGRRRGWGCAKMKVYINTFLENWDHFIVNLSDQGLSTVNCLQKVEVEEGLGRVKVSDGLHNRNLKNLRFQKLLGSHQSGLRGTLHAVVFCYFSTLLVDLVRRPSLK